MACYNPMLMSMVYFGKFPLFRARLIELGYKVNTKTDTAYRLLSQESRHIVLENIPEYINQKIFEVGCGKCLGCRLDYSKDWANRCSLEAMQYDSNYFITLTYDEDHLVYGKLGNPTIVKEHVDKFLNSLRKKYLRKFNHKGIRYFGCQEYGDKFMRNHSHIIFFNLPIPDLQKEFPQPDGTFILKREKLTGQYYLYSQFIQDLWPYGYVVIADANWNTEAYVSRYVMKKQLGESKKVYEETLGVLPPYLFMSRNPGIGSQFFEDNYDELCDNPSLILPRQHKKPLLSGLPRSFKKKIKERSSSVYNKMLEKAKDKSAKNLSLLRGKITINDNRSNSELRLVSKSNVFVRDFS